MSGRYAGWRKLKGDTDRPDLLDVGKRLLGFLDNQRKLSGVPTMGQQVTLPDGSVVWARWLGDQPEILIREGGAKPVPPTLEGLVVRPLEITDAENNTALSHVVLAHPTFRPVYFNQTMGPAAVAKAPFYDKLFPDGIGLHGNLDWRNANGTVSVTFFGPQSRYFGGTFSNRVYFKGKLLLPHDSELRGACLKTSGRTGTLFVISRTYPNSGTTDTLYAYPVVVDGPGDSIATAPRIKLAEEVSPFDRELVLTWDYGLYEFPNDDHPWMFNQACTEARCILHNSTTNAHIEHVVTKGSNGWAYSTAGTYPDPFRERTDQSATVSTQPYTHTYLTGNFVNEFVWDGTNVTWNGPMPDPNTSIPPPEQRGVSERGGTGAIETHTPVSIVTSFEETLTLEWVRVAVDFKNNVPVYAEARAQTSSGGSTFTRTVTGGQTYHYAVTSWYVDASDQRIVEGITTITYNCGNVASFAREESGTVRGIRTSFGEWLDTFTLLQTTDQESSESTSHSHPTSGAQGGIYTVGLAPGTYYTGVSGSGGATIEDYTLTGTWSAQCDFSRVTVYNYNFIEYLDLRHDFAVIGEVVVTDQYSASDAKTHPYNDFEDGYQYSSTGALNEPVLEMPYTYEGTHTLKVRTYLGGQEVATSDTITTFYNTFTTTTNPHPSISAEDVYYSGRQSNNEPMRGANLLQQVMAHDATPQYGTNAPSDSSSSSGTQVVIPSGDALRDWLRNNSTLLTYDYLDRVFGFTGGAQTYRGDFVTSMLVGAVNVPASTTTQHRVTAAGKAGQAVDLTTITDIATPRFYPVSFLPPTR